ncbi:MAG TPA: PDZ domain-containing protein [Bacteroidota bacterium]|nr:PDZ domain-containing protein [Bacteroidota bacterium]
MHISRLLSVTLLLVVSTGLITAKSVGGTPVLSYTLSMPKPATHLFEVEMEVRSLPSGRSLDFLLPVWRPGRYVVLDFASGIQDFAASNGKDEALTWEKTAKSTWHVETNGAPSVRIRYKVYADEFYLRTRGLNSDHGFVDGSAVFMYVEALRHLTLTLTVHPYQGWHVTTGLDGDGTVFTAPSYDVFVDCPLEIGTQKDYPFDVDGVPHLLGIAGDGDWNKDTLVRDFTTIVRQQKEFWGGLPYSRYVFLVECTSNPTGATEHLNSTIIQTYPFSFRQPDRYRGFLRNVEHEFFHTWNVKRLRPRGLDPYNFQEENYSREIWIAEGTTSYYEEILALRAGFSTRSGYLDGVAENVRSDRSRPGNLVEPLSETSFDAWVKNGKGNEQRMNAESDFYEKGAAVSLLLDLTLRERSANAHSLDDVMREMFRRYPLSGGGYTLRDFQSVAEDVSGCSLKEFFEDYVYGVKPLPWEKLLLGAGVDLAPKDSIKKAWLGLGTYDEGDKIHVSNVVAGSPAEEAGFEVGDDILALNGYHVNQRAFSDRVGLLKEGDSVKVTIFRDERLRELQVRIGSAPVPAYTATEVKNPSEVQKKIFEGWLGTEGREKK